MARGRRRLAWTIAAQHMAVLANCNRASNQQAATPDDFLPADLVDKPARAQAIKVSGNEGLKILAGAMQARGFKPS